MAKSNLATRPPPPSAEEEIEARVAAVVPGQTVIVLKSGAILTGRLMPTSVRRVKNARDPNDGGPVYKVDWNLEMGKLAPEDAVPLETINKLSS